MQAHIREDTLVHALGAWSQCVCVWRNKKKQNLPISWSRQVPSTPLLMIVVEKDEAARSQLRGNLQSDQRSAIYEIDLSACLPQEATTIIWIGTARSSLSAATETYIDDLYDKLVSHLGEAHLLPICISVYILKSKTRKKMDFCKSGPVLYAWLCIDTPKNINNSYLTSGEL